MTELAKFLTQVHDNQILRTLEHMLALYALFRAFKKLRSLTQGKHKCLTTKKRRHFPDEHPTFAHFFANEEGLWIFTRQWLVAKPKGVVYVCHGFAEHIGRYEGLARRLNAEGYTVLGMDHQAHGQSEGDRTLINNEEHLIRDYFQFIGREDPALKPLPHFLLGHSMGGGIAFHVSQRRKELWTGVVLSAPLLWFRPEDLANPLKGVLKPIQSWFPRIGVLPKLAAAKVAGSAVGQMRYEADSLNTRGGVMARTAHSLTSLFQNNEPLFPLYDLPFLLWHGEADEVVYVPNSERLFKESTSKDKTLKLVPKVKHEALFDEPEVAQGFMDDVAQWINARC